MREIKTKVWLKRNEFGDYAIWKKVKQPNPYNHPEFCEDYGSGYFVTDGVCPTHIKKFIPIKHHIKLGSNEIIEAEMIFRVK